MVGCAETVAQMEVQKMDQKKAVLALIAEILAILDGDPPPAKPSWSPYKRGAARNGSSLALLSLILGILLGVIAALVLKGCTMQNACIVGAGPSETVDTLGILEAFDGIDTDTEFDASVL